MKIRKNITVGVLYLLAAGLVAAVFFFWPRGQAPEWVRQPAPQDEHALAVYDVMKDLGVGLSSEIRFHRGKWAVYVEDLEAGVGFRAEKDASCGESMVSASIIKIFIMAAAYEDVDAGKFSEEALSDDIYEMITYSDNEATNRLVTALGQGDPGAGMARVNAYARSVGCPNTRMERLMLVENGKQNYVSILDCARLLRMMYEGQCVSAARAEQMLSILKEQRWNDYIPKGPPEGTAIAHKSGDLIGIVQGDVGIVYDGKGPYIVCIICNDPPSFKRCERQLAEISRLINDHMARRP